MSEPSAAEIHAHHHHHHHDEHMTVVLTDVEDLHDHEASQSLNDRLIGLDDPNNTHNQIEQNETTDLTESIVLLGDGLTPPESTVPKLANDEQIFELLCKKIAKYCQLLAKLTSCEVFYKAELARNTKSKQRRIFEEDNEGETRSALTDEETTSRTRPKRYKPKNVRNPNVRSLYWGTNRLLYEFTHERGIRFEKTNGDALIDVAELGSSVAIENIEMLIDEIVNGPGARAKASPSFTVPPKPTKTTTNQSNF